MQAQSFASPSTAPSAVLARPHPTQPSAASAAVLQRLREAEGQQALTELFPHLRLEAYNALRELFPTQSAQ
ncbi:hypothetical protein [Aquabacterium sp.]|uniref:hypothetical protein n=1 Tax=Aquabacterium sp. TaxID=1872578 RepID=UPI002BF81C2C|nr:hypothetical protein [Aquabacterium sp.]HSW07978.1 hypothetical protein [Aquabacterium sp.]